MNTKFRIAIDGPASAGKSTVSKRLSKKLGIIYVDTGAMYRAVALYILQHGIDPENEEQVTAALQDISVTIQYIGGEQAVLLNGEDVTGSLRTEQVGHVASVTSTYPAVRKHLLTLQQKLAKEQSVVMDGRDIGTCVIPDAELKIFLTASAEERANRRFLELKKKDVACVLEEIKKDMAERDFRDAHREIAPLKQAEDAVLIDSSKMTVENVCDTVISEIGKRVTVKHFEMIEDNGGGLTLAVFNAGGHVEYLHTIVDALKGLRQYEHQKTQDPEIEKM